MCDYPQHTAVVLFSPGCAFACPYCHNAELRNSGATPAIPWSDVQEFLRGRMGKVDAVVFSGGEPLLQTHLGEAIRRVARMGFKTGLHTAGYPAGALDALLASPDTTPDWVGMDIKGTADDYEDIAGHAGFAEDAFDSMAALQAGHSNFEIRTTLPSNWTWEGFLLPTATAVSRYGVEAFAVQVPTGTRKPSHEEIGVLRKMFPVFTTRFYAHDESSKAIRARYG